MATTPTPISDLPATTTLADNDLVIVQKANGNTSKMTGAKLKEIVTPPASTWGGTTGKPFDEVGSGLNISLSGSTKKLNANAPSWASVTGKPFSSVGNGLTVENDQLKAAQTWSGTTGKPFSTIGSGLSVENGALIAADGSVFYATQSTTSLADIQSAYNAGRSVKVVISSTLVGDLFYIDNYKAVFFNVLESGAGGSMLISTCTAPNYWTSRSFSITGGGGGGDDSSFEYVLYDLSTFADVMVAFNKRHGVRAFRSTGEDHYFYDLVYLNPDNTDPSTKGTAIFSSFEPVDNGLMMLFLVDNTWSEMHSMPLFYPNASTTIGAVPTHIGGGAVEWQVPSAGSATWSSVTGKPFNSIGSGLSVSGGVLSATGGGSGDDIFIINVTQSGSTYTPDKTYSEASAAYDAGKILIMRINQGEYYAKSKYSQGIAFGNGAELFEGAISATSYRFGVNGTVTLYEESASFNNVVSKPTSSTPSGYVPTSNGSGGYSWQAQQGSTAGDYDLVLSLQSTPDEVFTGYSASVISGSHDALFNKTNDSAPFTKPRVLIVSSLYYYDMLYRMNIEPESVSVCEYEGDRQWDISFSNPSNFNESIQLHYNGARIAVRIFSFPDT